MAPNSEARVWLIISNRWNSAITEYALSVGQALRLRGNQIFIGCLKSSPCEKRALQLDFAVQSFPAFGISALPQFQKNFSTINPQTIITFGGPESFLARFLGNKNQVTKIRFRGQDSDMKKEPFSPFFRLAHKCFHGILTPNQQLKEKYERIFRQPVMHVTLGCDEKNFTPQAQAPTNEILIVGRFDSVKGHKRAFEIFSRFKAMAPDLPARLHVLGESANISGTMIRELALAAGLREDKDFLLSERRHPDVGKLMAEAAVGFIPSLDSEVICRVGEEFLLAGTPLFVSGAGALNELLRFPLAGESYLGASSDEAARKLVFLYQKAVAEREEERRKRATLARFHFSLSAMGQALEDAILRVRPH